MRGKVCGGNTKTVWRVAWRSRVARLNELQVGVSYVDTVYLSSNINLAREANVP